MAQRRGVRRLLSVFASSAFLFGMCSTGIAQQVGDTESVGTEEQLETDGNHQERRVVLALDGGIGTFTESPIEHEAELWFLGTTVRWNPDVLTELFAEFDVGIFQRQYVQLGVGTAGQSVRVDEEELHIGGSIAYGYDLLNAFDVDWWVFAGWRHLAVRNDRFDEHLTGGLVGSRLQWPISNMFAMDFHVDHTLNLLNLADESKADQVSSAGGIVGSLRFGADFQIFASDMIQFGIGYEGEHLPHDFTDLLVHQFAVEFAVHLWY